MPGISVAVGDPSIGDVSKAIVTNAKATLTYPCQSSAICTYYSVTLREGKYLLEVWGSQGGSDANFPDEAFGGRGGYSKGILTVKSRLKLYVHIGGMGTGSKSSNWGSSGGGGSTDIRLISGVWNSTNSIKSRILVAGGGGGRHGKKYEGPQAFIGNDGGGEKAPTFTVPTNGRVVTVSGGTQSNGGSSNTEYAISVSQGKFGYSQQNREKNTYSLGGYNGGSPASDGYPNGGAGGGWWGGCVSWPTGSGGSGFVFNHTTAPIDYPVEKSFYLSSGELKAGNAQFLNPFGVMGTGNIGNGAAKITLLSQIPLMSKKVVIYQIFTKFAKIQLLLS